MIEREQKMEQRAHFVIKNVFKLEGFVNFEIYNLSFAAISNLKKQQGQVRHHTKGFQAKKNDFFPMC